MNRYFQVRYIYLFFGIVSSLLFGIGLFSSFANEDISDREFDAMIQELESELEIEDFDMDLETIIPEEENDVFDSQEEVFMVLDDPLDITPEPTPDIRNLCDAETLSSARSSAVDATGSVGGTRIGGSGMVSVYETKRSLLGGDGEIAIDINYVGNPAYNGKMDITLPLGHSYVSSESSGVMTGIEIDERANGQKIETVTIENLKPLANGDDDSIIIKTKILNGNEISDDPETETVDEADILNIHLGKSYGGTVKYSISQTAGGAPVEQVSAGFSNSIAGMRIEGQNARSTGGGVILTGDSSENVGVNFLVRSSPLVSSDTPFIFVYTLPAEIDLDLDSIVGNPVIDYQARTLTWNFGILSPNEYANPKNIAFNAHIPFRESWFTELGDKCDGDIIPHLRGFESSYKSSTQYTDTKTVIITSEDEETGEVVVDSRESIDVPVPTNENVKQEYVAEHIRISISPEYSGSYDSGSLHTEDTVTHNFNVVVSDYYDGIDLSIRVSLPNGFEYITSSELWSERDNNTFLFNTLPDVPAGTSLEVLEVESILSKEYLNTTEVVGNDFFSTAIVFGATADSIIQNDPAQWTVFENTGQRDIAESPFITFDIDSDDGNGNPNSDFVTEPSELWFQVGDIVHAQLTYSSTVSMPSKDQYLELLIPAEFEFIEGSEVYSHTGNFDPLSSSVHTNVGTPEIVKYSESQNKLTWFLGDSTTNNLPPEWKTVLQFRVKDELSVQDGTLRNANFRLSGKQSRVSLGGLYVFSKNIPIQYVNPQVQTIKIITSEDGTIIDTPEAFLNLSPEDILTTTITLTNTSPIRSISSVAYNLEFQDNILPVFLNIDNVQVETNISSPPEVLYDQENHRILSTPFDLVSQEIVTFSYTGKFQDLDFGQTYTSISSASHRSLQNPTGYERIWTLTTLISDLWTDVFTFITPSPTLTLQTSKSYIQDPETGENILQNQYLEEQVTHTLTANFPVSVQKTLINPVLQLIFPHEGISVDTSFISSEHLQIAKDENGEGIITFSSQSGQSVVAVSLEDIYLDGKSGNETVSEYQQILRVPFVFTGKDNAGNPLLIDQITPVAKLSWSGGGMESEVLDQPVVYQLKRSGGGNTDFSQKEGRYIEVSDNISVTNSQPISLDVGVDGVAQYRIREYNSNIHSSQEQAPWSQWYDVNMSDVYRDPESGFEQITIPWDGVDQSWKDGVYSLTAQFNKPSSLQTYPDTSIDTIIYDTHGPKIAYKLENNNLDNHVNIKNIAITLDDEQSDISKFEYQINNGEWIQLEVSLEQLIKNNNALGSVFKTLIEIPAENGEDIYINYRATDSVGNISTTSSQFITNTPIDHSAVGIMSINSDDKYTNSRYVSLNTNTQRYDIASMRFRNISHLEDGNILEEGWSRSFPYSTDMLWEIREPKGIKTVEVEYVTDTGEIITGTDTIIYSDAFGVEYAWMNENNRVYEPASEQTFTFHMKNLGYTPWVNNGDNATRLSYRLKDSEGNILEELGDRTDFIQEYVEYSQTGEVSIAIPMPDIQLSDIDNAYILEFDLVTGDSGYFSQKNIVPLQIPITISGERENIEELILDALGGVGGIKAGYAVYQLGALVEYAGNIIYYTPWKTPSVKAGELFSHTYYIRNIGSQIWKVGDVWGQNIATDVTFPVQSLQSPVAVSTDGVNTDAEMKLTSTSYAPNRPGTTQQILWDLFSSRGEDLITGGYVYMPIKIESNCTPNYQQKCVGNTIVWFDSCNTKGQVHKQCSSGCMENANTASCDNGLPQISTVVSANNTESVTVNSKILVTGNFFGAYDWEKSELYLDGEKVEESDIKSWSNTAIRFFAREKLFTNPSSQITHQLKVKRSDEEWDLLSFDIAENGCQKNVQTVCGGDGNNTIFFANSCGDIGKKIDTCNTGNSETCISTNFDGMTTSSCVYKGPKFTGISNETVRNEEYIEIYGNFLDEIDSSPTYLVFTNTNTGTSVNVDILSITSGKIDIQVPEILPAGSYTIIPPNISDTSTQYLTQNIEIESDWCADLETPQHYTLELEPGERYTFSSRWRNTCSNTWARGTKIFDDHDNIVTRTNSTSEEKRSGESVEQIVTLVAPKNTGVHKMKLFLHDPKNDISTTTKNDKYIDITIRVSQNHSEQTDPQIITCPTQTAMGDRLVLTGKNFSPGGGSTYTNRGSVLLGGVVHEGKWIEKWTDTSIVVKVQSSVGEGYRNIDVQLQNGRTSTQTCETNIQSTNPVIKLVQPNPNTPGNILTIRGENFGKTVGVVYLKVGGEYYRHDGTNNTILTWKEDIVELHIQDNIQLGRAEVFLKRQDGKESNFRPITIRPNENCSMLPAQRGTALYAHPYASTNTDKGLIATLGNNQILKPIEWGTDPNTQTKWIHAIAGTFQGWIRMDEINTDSCAIDLNELQQSPLHTSWAKVLRGELEYVSTNKEIRLVKYKNSFPPIYTPGGEIYEGERMYVIKTEGEWAQVMTDDGKVGWTDKSYLNIDPSPYIGMMLFPLAGDDENKILATQEYGWTEYALAGLYDGGKHEGIDLVPLQTDDEIMGKGCNAPVFSARTGTVSQICKDEIPDNEESPDCKNNGNLLYVDHGAGLVSSYAHLNSIDSNIYVDKVVDDRTLLGRTGNTGQIFGDENICHLDFGVWQDGASQNPYRYFRAEGRYMTSAEREELGVGGEVIIDPSQYKYHHYKDRFIGSYGMIIEEKTLTYYDSFDEYNAKILPLPVGTQFSLGFIELQEDGTKDVRISVTIGETIYNGTIDLEMYGITWMNYVEECGGKFTDTSDAIVNNMVNARVINPPDRYKYCEFRPDGLISRAEFAKIMSLGMDIDTYKESSIGIYFDDVGEYKTINNEWYYPYVYGLANANIINKPEGGKESFYNPAYALNFAEISKFLVKGIDAKFLEQSTCYDEYLRDGHADIWYGSYIGLLVASGIVDTDYFSPSHNITRLEMLELLDAVRKDEKGDENIKEEINACENLCGNYEDGSMEKLICYIEELETTHSFTNEEIVGVLIKKVYEPEGWWRFSMPEGEIYRTKKYSEEVSTILDQINIFHQCPIGTGCSNITGKRLTPGNNGNKVNVGHVFAGLTIPYFTDLSNILEFASGMDGGTLTPRARTYVGDLGAVLWGGVTNPMFGNANEEDKLQHLNFKFNEGILKKGDLQADVDSHVMNLMIISQDSTKSISEVLREYYEEESEDYNKRFEIFGNQEVIIDEDKDQYNEVVEALENEIASFAMMLRLYDISKGNSGYNVHHHDSGKVNDYEDDIVLFFYKALRCVRDEEQGLGTCPLSSIEIE